MQDIITVNVSMRKISSFPLGILLLFILLFVQQLVFETCEFGTLSLNDQPTNPTRPRTPKILSVSCIVNESKETQYK